MSNLIEQQLRRLSDHERAELEKLAEAAGMTVYEWVEFSQKAQIYHNAEERLAIEPAA